VLGFCVLFLFATIPMFFYLIPYFYFFGTF
jgi:ABC-type proline/glycine betaine transport system permease subunit